MRSVSTTSCQPLGLVSDIDIILDASSYFSNETVNLKIPREKNACTMEGVYSPAFSSATSSMRALKHNRLISILKVILCNDSLDQSHTVTR